MGRRRAPRIKEPIPDYAEQFRRSRVLDPPNASAVAKYWRALALALLAACQRRDPSLARRLGPLALHYADCLTLPVDASLVEHALVRKFSKELETLPAHLTRGKSKPLPVVS